jgi:6,7-dimethyl-8-ribityllumazine synthase
MAQLHQLRPIQETPIPGARILLIEARFQEAISDELVAGARARLEAAKVEIEHIRVPGALEIPIAAAIALDAATRAGRPFDGLVALGCVIRGETFHFEIVAGESARALMDLGVHGVCRSVTAFSRSRTKRRLSRAQIAAKATKAARLRLRHLPSCALPARAPSKAMAKLVQRSAARLAAVQALYQMDIAAHAAARHSVRI